jgi:DNA-binding FrmR family transcriptional regulator
MVLAELFLGVVGNAIYDLSKTGLVEIFSGAAAKRAIRATARDYPDIKVVEDALTKWCNSDQYIATIDSIRSGRTEGADEALIESFVEVGLFHDGLHNTHESARRVLDTFATHLRRELYRTQDGLLIESARADLRQQETKEHLAALREEVRTGLESLLADKSKLEDIQQQIAASATPPELTNRTTLNVLSYQLDSVSSELSDEKLEKLQDLRELFREGAFQDAYESVRQFRQSANWVSFSDGLRAAVLRALASMTLSLKGAGGVVDAAALAEEARKADPSEDDVTLRARIRIFEDGHEAALGELSSTSTLDSFNLRVGLLIETGRVEEALESLRRPPEGVAFDAETHRLYALALLAAKDIQGAREHIARASAERPRRLYVRFNAAMIDFFSSLSPVVLPPHLIPYPRPFPLSMVRGDAESRERMLRAAETCKQIAEQSPPGSDELKTPRLGAWLV